MSVNSKNKGNTFERKISKLLSETFKARTGLETAFRRNIDSGSFFGGSNQRRTITHDTSKACFGDIVTPDDFIFTLECKHYATPPSFASILKQECATLDKWIEQAKQDAESAGKTMMIIAKFNNVPEMVVIPKSCKTKAVPAMLYKGHHIFLLSDILKEPISHFFVD
jgi:hypothetical protein